MLYKMFKSIFYSYFAVIVIFAKNINGINLCGDWIQYNDIKCFKVLNKTVTEEEALKNCNQLESKSTLITIHSKDEQQFLDNILKDYNTSNAVWIGMKYYGQNYRWLDGTDINYTNWAEDAVKDGTDPCVQMSLVRTTFSQWTDVSCKKVGLTVCQKKAELDLNVLKNSFEFLEKQLNYLIPIGFLYTQLPNQSSPQQLWPTMQWLEVTQQYSGLFFRAEGSGSEQFGKVQSADQSWISSANLIGWFIGSGGRTGNKVTTDFKKGAWTELHADGVHDHISLFTSDGEVRPRNTAIKIWKRIK